MVEKRIKNWIQISQYEQCNLENSLTTILNNFLKIILLIQKVELQGEKK